MTKQGNILSRSKKAETRVARYLFGEDAARDWKENYDISGLDAEGNLWIGEIKNYTWPATIGGFSTLLTKAFEQAETYGDRVFAVFLPKGSSVDKALVVYRMNSVPVIVTIETFKALMVGDFIE